ncbi:unnamed protein product [Protopolystoma xenopodis]|uniref:Cytidyltransferase-like domain-containing protein n=1 Tax=Protopolystoma xenopodis TaxID=117903 RepID=A0A3S5FHE3_9PLAT|nr:unnamed protein product [Protopolystoma xenopodis]
MVKEWCHNDLSATLVRRALSRGQSVRYLVPDATLDEIYAAGLYGARSQTRQTSISHLVGSVSDAVTLRTDPRSSTLGDREVAKDASQGVCTKPKDRSRRLGHKDVTVPQSLSLTDICESQDSHWRFHEEANEGTKEAVTKEKREAHNRLEDKFARLAL